MAGRLLWGVEGRSAMAWRLPWVRLDDDDGRRMEE
jgi:hypothetical protein